MTALKHIIVFLLALQLANPAHCCLWRDCTSTAPSASPPERSCCGQPAGKSNDESPQDHECLCALADQLAEPKEAKFSFHTHAISPPPRTLEVFELASDLPRRKLTFFPVTMPAGPPARLMFSVFRL